MVPSFFKIELPTKKKRSSKILIQVFQTQLSPIEIISKPCTHHWRFPRINISKSDSSSKYNSRKKVKIMNMHELHQKVKEFDISIHFLLLVDYSYESRNKFIGRIRMHTVQQKKKCYFKENDCSVLIVWCNFLVHDVLFHFCTIQHI